MPLQDTGSPQGDIIARLYTSRQDGLPSEIVTERSISDSEWKQNAGKPLSIDFGVDLKENSNYVVAFSSGGDSINHRSLAVSGLNSFAVTPNYGGGEALILRDGNWQSIADGKESIFFATVADSKANH